MTQPTLDQLIKSYEKYRPSCTPSMIQSVRQQLQEPTRYSEDNSRMRAYLQWRLHVSSKQLDAILLGSFVTLYGDELTELADEL